MLDGLGFFCLFLALAAAVSGCATLESAQTNAQDFADRSGFVKERISTSFFKLTTYRRLEGREQPLTVYIEGDGIAFRSYGPSMDPTPVHLLVLELAKRDPSINVAYLARPCQFDNSASEAPCAEEFWTDKRFSKEVIVSMDQALDILKTTSAATEIDLIGYSGGGAVAILLAARRQDIRSIRTLAGNLDPTAVNRAYRLGPLKGSLDPMDVASKISSIPQRHFIGMDDKVMPASVADGFVERVGNGDCAKVIRFQGVTHHAGWEEHGKDIYSVPVCG